MALVSDWLLICVLFLAGLFGASLSITEQPQEDPDVLWADTIGQETRAAVSSVLEAYLIDPDNAPACWEDEAVIIVIDHAHPDYGLTTPARVGQLGCVPLDNLPVSGFRP